MLEDGQPTHAGLIRDSLDFGYPIRVANRWNQPVFERLVWSAWKPHNGLRDAYSKHLSKQPVEAEDPGYRDDDDDDDDEYIDVE